MAVTVPPLPYKSPMISQAGFLTEAWSKWFRDMFNRIGGVSALSNTELAAQQSDELDAVEADVAALEVIAAALQVLTASHTASITAAEAEIEGLSQGRQL